MKREYAQNAPHDKLTETILGGLDEHKTSDKNNSIEQKKYNTAHKPKLFRNDGKYKIGALLRNIAGVAMCSLQKAFS